MIGVGRVVAGLHQLQPGAQRRLRTVEEVAHPETGEDLQAQISQRPLSNPTMWSAVFIKHLKDCECNCSAHNKSCLRLLINLMLTHVALPLMRGRLQVEDVELPAFLIVKHVSNGLRDVAQCDRNCQLALADVWKKSLPHQDPFQACGWMIKY